MKYPCCYGIGHISRFLLLVLSVFTCEVSLRAQLAELSGQNPPRIKWHEISDTGFRVVYPDGADSFAQKALNTLMHIRDPVTRSLNCKVRPVAIVIQNQNTDNNAFVTGGARRAEFYITPPQNPYGLGLNDWLEELCVHEYRHVVQLDKAMMGWGKGLYYFFGNTGLTMAEGLTNPWWFWEGDAVGCETAMGYGGRGRLPSFDVTLRMRLLENKAFGYEKATCGSMHDFVSNHYVLGYFITTYIKNHYSIQTWDSILSRSYRKFPWPHTFSRSVKKYTGMGLPALYRAMTLELKDSWSKQLQSAELLPARAVPTPAPKHFTNYRFPCYLSNGKMVAFKSGMGTGGVVAHKSAIQDISKLVLVDTSGREKILCMTGVLDDNGKLSAGGNKVVWTETTWDPRWGARNYTDIFIYDVQRNRKKQLTKKQRLHAPDITVQGDKIAAVELTTNSMYNLCIADSKTGSIIQRIPSPGNLFMLQPHWAEDGKSLCVLLAKPGFKSIHRVYPETGNWEVLLDWVPENLATPVLYKNYVIFNSAQTGIDNVYALDYTNGETYPITGVPYGAFHATVSPEREEIVFHNYTLDGARLCRMKLDSSNWKPAEMVRDFEKKYNYFAGFEHKEGGNLLKNIPQKKYPVSRYRRLYNSINIYGWGYQPTTSSSDLHLGFHSQDLISSTMLNGGVSWDANERRTGRFFEAKYLGWYPVLTLSWTENSRNDFYSFQGYGHVFKPPFHDYYYQTTELDIGVPLNFSKSRFMKKMHLGLSPFYSRISQAHILSKDYAIAPSAGFHGVKYRFSYAVKLRQSIMDVAPRLGYSVDVSYMHTPFGSELQGKQLALNSEWYLPGIGRHHAIRLRGLYQYNVASSYYFRNPFIMVRGAPNMLADEMYIASAEYRLPLAFPDLNVGGMLFIQRLRTAFFSDFGYGRAPAGYADAGQWKTWRTVGIEQTADLNFIRFLVPFNVGVQVGRDLDRGTMQYRFVLSVVGY
ncbi:MAG: hypothetical protein JNL57_07425 [Bacteroidetes bacterium]|nr:hypothetical protein [Bacteroidota bacterium]